MNYCEKCGSVIPDGQTQCPNCVPEKPAQDVQEKINDIGDNLKNTAQTVLENCADHTAEYDADDITSNRGMAILSYFSWLVLIPIIKAKTPYVKFHANQGLILAIAGTAGYLLVWVLSALFGRVFLLKTIVKLLRLVVYVLIAIFSILGIVNAANDKAKELPIIGGIRILK